MVGKDSLVLKSLIVLTPGFIHGLNSKCIRGLRSQLQPPVQVLKPKLLGPLFGSDVLRDTSVSTPA